jgi:hypothetical protein
LHWIDWIDSLHRNGDKNCLSDLYFLNIACNDADAVCTYV